MNIKCLAENYVVQESGDSHFVYNEIYEASTKFIFLAALLGVFYPDASEYDIPICIELKNCDGMITIGKKLEVIGNADAKYFIAKHQYQKWKNTYRLATCFIYFLVLLLNVLFVFLFWRTHFNVGIGLCELCVLCLGLGVIAKFETKNRKGKGYEMINITF